ncbi:hypothetical protein CF597_22705 [Pseudomonas sp. PSB1]|nr:hypothetical protein [Pseudomonas sp. PSB1]
MQFVCCGREVTHESMSTADINARPTPLVNANLRSQQIQCGSEPARDSGASGNSDVECNGLIASRLAPTGIGGKMKDSDPTHRA